MRTNTKGFTLIELMIVVAIIAIIAAIAIPNLLRARIAANESSAIGSLRTLASAESTAQQSTAVDVDANGIGEYMTLAALSTGSPPFIDEQLGGATKSGYWFRVNVGDAGGTAETTWSAEAVPVNAGTTGNRAFWVDESGVVRGSIGPVAFAGPRPAGTPFPAGYTPVGG